MLIQCSGVTKRFGDRVAVDNLDLEVPEGMCFGLLGPNGAGKTTTLRMMYGVTRPDAGSIHVFGLDVAVDTRAVRARLGVTLQQNVFLEALTPEENLRIFGRYHLLHGDELEKRIQELLDFLELRSHAKVPVRFLSGGFQRRLSIAQSLMNGPELLVLDEPTTGLDPAVRQALWGRVRQLRAAGTTVLLTTHYMDEAQRLCDRVAIMCNGGIIADGAPEELIRSRLAPEAVELDCRASEEGRILDGIPVAHRLRAGSRLILFVDDGAHLAEQIRPHSEKRGVIVRPTNLEDVFLKLTGTSLS